MHPKDRAALNVFKAAVIAFLLALVAGPRYVDTTLSIGLLVGSAIAFANVFTSESLKTIRRVAPAIVAACAIAAASPLYAGNSCFRQPIVTRAYVAPVVASVVAPPQFVTQNIFYEVGRDVRYPAVAPQAVIQAEAGQIQREMQRLQDRFAELRQYQQQSQQPQPQIICVPYPAQQQQGAAAYCPPGTQPAYAPQTQQPGQCAPQQPNGQQPQPQPQNPTTFSMKQGGVIEAKCLKCHGGNGPPKGDLDLRGSITCEQFHAAMKRLLTDDESIRMPKGQPPLTPEETAAAMKELSAMVAEGLQPPQQAPAKQPVQANVPASIPWQFTSGKTQAAGSFQQMTPQQVAEMFTDKR